MLSKTLRSWLIFFGVALGPFMICLDFLSIGVAIEPMAKALSISLPTLQWLITAFAIGNSSFLVAAGFLADRYGRKKIFASGVIIFVVSSTIIACSSFAWIIFAARFFQGMSGGLMVTTATAIIMKNFPPEERAAWISGLVGSAGLGMVLGPLVGGFLVHHFSWRMIFIINLPIGLINFFLMRFVPKDEATGEKRRFDGFGILLLISFLMLLTVSLNRGDEWGWLSVETGAAFAVSLLLFILFFWWENKITYPVFEFRFFKIENFFAANVAGFSDYFLFTSWVLIYGIYLQRVMGLTAQETGIVFLPFGLALFLASLFMKKITEFFHFKQLILIGYICAACDLASLIK